MVLWTHIAVGCLHCDWLNRDLGNKKMKKKATTRDEKNNELKVIQAENVPPLFYLYGIRTSLSRL